MSSEANLPEMSAPQAPPPVVPSGSQDMQIAGDGQQGAGNGRGRRRRRKRKKTGTTTAPQGEGQQQANGGENAGAISASGEGQPQQQGQQNQQGQGQGKRWKKKKFRRAGEGGGDRQPRPEPGNSIHANGNGGRRNNRQKQRGPRQFVGPMDHMYREVNGNYSDAPPSTIEVHGNHRRNHGNGRQREFNEDRLPPELLTNARAVAIPEDAPTHIYFFVEDLFLTAKINETSRQQGVKVAFMKPEKDIVAHFADLNEHDHPSLIVFDLNNAAMKALTLIPKLKAKLKKGTSIIGFLNLLQAGDVKMKAMEAGCNTVMTKAAFSQSLPNLIRRYGVSEEEEQNFNQ
ncbi:MAG: response regulator [Acidobacteria bacterium]|nr:response regulator [Acidobacteriota bacterium]